jgi:hypothetical protein
MYLQVWQMLNNTRLTFRRSKRRNSANQLASLPAETQAYRFRLRRAPSCNFLHEPYNSMEVGTAWSDSLKRTPLCRVALEQRRISGGVTLVRSPLIAKKRIGLSCPLFSIDAVS